MNCRLGWRPVAAVVCVLSLAAAACGTSDNEQPSAQTAITIPTAESALGNNQDADTNRAASETGTTTPSAAPSTTSADTSTAAETGTTTTNGTAAETGTTTTNNTAAETGTTTTNNTAAETGTTTTNNTAAETGTTTTNSTAAETGTTTATSEAPDAGPDTTTGTTAQVDLAVSPWPVDPRVTGDREWTVRIEASWRHDTDAFTQGLETDGTIIYESTGLYGESRLRALDRAAELRSVAIDGDLFGEGLTLVGDEIIQLSWREGRALRWDRETFEPRGEFVYQGEGWGICWDQVGSRLLMSDGTSTLTHRDRYDFAVVATTTVTRNAEPVRRINELECVDGLVVANIWMTNEIIVFDPDSGEVLVSIDAGVLAAEAGISSDETHAVLNGVAYNGDGEWILGGKNWPLQFLVTFTFD